MIEISPQQCRAARSMLGMHQEELCGRSGVTIKTLSDFEKGKTKPYASTLEKIREALEAAGVVFVDSNGLGAGVRLREPGE